jgi:hypothetical protein
VKFEALVELSNPDISGLDIIPQSGGIHTRDKENK